MEGTKRTTTQVLNIIQKVLETLINLLPTITDSMFVR